MKALLVIDMLNDFCRENGALYVPQAEEIIPSIAKLVNIARENRVPVIYANDSHEENDEEFKKWPRHAVKNTWGVEVVEELAPREGDTVIEKTRYDAFYKTELDCVLKKLEVKDLYLTGVVTNICVLATGMSAAIRGYQTKVVKECVKDLPSELAISDNLYAFERRFPLLGMEVISVNQALREMRYER
jgi:nicotinamidase-related amidase